MTLAYLNQTSYSAMLKTMYSPKRVANVSIKKRPFLRTVKKVDDMDGNLYAVPVQYELPGGASATFSKSQANVVASKYVRFTSTVKEKFQTNGITALTLRSSRRNRGAFARARKREVDGMLRSLGRSASIALFRDSTGYVGTIDQTVFSTPIVTMETASDAANLGVGFVCQFIDVSATPDVLLDAGEELTVVSVQEDAGTVTFNLDLDTIAAIADGDRICKSGDFNGEIMGLEGWLPLVAPASGDSFQGGVDRSVHPTRLAGQRLTKPNQRIEESIMELAELCTKADGDPDYAFVSHENYTRMVKSLGTPEYTNKDRIAHVGFRGIIIHTSAGDVEVYADPDCPKNVGYVVQMDTFTLHTLDPFPHIDEIDGLMALRASGADALEVRSRYWGELFCDAPAWSGSFQIST